MTVIATVDPGHGSPLHVTYRVSAIGSTDAAEQAKAEARLTMRIKTLGGISLAPNQTYTDERRERLDWDVVLVVRPRE